MVAKNMHLFSEAGIIARMRETSRAYTTSELGALFNTTCHAVQATLNLLMGKGQITSAVHGKKRRYVLARPKVAASTPYAMKPYVQGREWATVTERIAEARVHPSKFFD